MMNLLSYVKNTSLPTLWEDSSNIHFSGMAAAILNEGDKGV
jgi:hypothetical protein